jgi:hypothetical protein
MNNVKHLLSCSLTLVAVLWFLVSPSAAQSFTFTTIDVPCSGCPGGVAPLTAIGGINPAGDIVGVYRDALNNAHGFLLSGGQFTTIDVPGSLVGVTGNLATTARGISPSVDIVGQFTAPYNPPQSTTAPVDSPVFCPKAGSAACIKGFLYRRGEFSAVMFPGHPGAIPGRITPDGSMYGCLHDFDTMDSMFSATWSRFGDTSLRAGGGELSDSTQSCPNSMHGGATPDGNIVVGFCVDVDQDVDPDMDLTNHTHGYILQNGVLQLYDVPNSTFTALWDINPGQEMVGRYVDPTGKGHGFLQLPDGSAPINIDVPSTPPFNAVSSLAMGINPGGTIVGQYTDTSKKTHGFVAVPSGNQ